MTTKELALVELNSKFQACVIYASLKYPQIDADEWAICQLQNDLERMKKMWGKAPIFDANYSRTWGYNALGMYKSLDEMQEVGSIVDAGF